MNEKLNNAIEMIIEDRMNRLINEIHIARLEIWRDIKREIAKDSEIKGKVFERVNVETPFTIEDLAETTDDTFIRKTIPYAKEWFEEKLHNLRYDFKEAIRDHDKELGCGIVDCRKKPYRR